MESRLQCSFAWSASRAGRRFSAVRLLRRLTRTVSSSSSACTLCVGSIRVDPRSCGQVLVSGQALEFFCQHILQDLLVEREVRHRALQLAVLFLELLGSSELARGQRRVLLAPGSECLQADAVLPGQILVTGTPASICFTAPTISCAVKLDFFIVSSHPDSLETEAFDGLFLRDHVSTRSPGHVVRVGVDGATESVGGRQ